MFAMMMAIGIAEDLIWQKHLLGLPPEARSDAIAKRQERMEKRRIEAIAERRHQELCSSIRSINSLL